MLCRHCKLVERASVDEAYLDLTDDVSARMSMMQNSTNGAAVTVDDVMLPNTHVVGYENAADDDKGTLRTSCSGIVVIFLLFRNQLKKQLMLLTLEISIVHNHFAIVSRCFWTFPSDDDHKVNSLLTLSVDNRRCDGLAQFLALTSRDSDDDVAATSSADDLRLAVAACIVEEMRKAVFDVTGFRCSAGIAHNKVMLRVLF